LRKNCLHGRLCCIIENVRRFSSVTGPAHKICPKFSKYTHISVMRLHPRGRTSIFPCITKAIRQFGLFAGTTLHTSTRDQSRRTLHPSYTYPRISSLIWKVGPHKLLTCFAFNNRSTSSTLESVEKKWEFQGTCPVDTTAHFFA
jgi:hypothetical protein